MNSAALLSNNAFNDAVNGWGTPSETIRLGQKIRVTFSGQKPKSGYAYKAEGSWLGIRYTWKSARWWSLLNYNNPLVKLEAQDLDGQGKEYWTTIWEANK